MADERKPVRVVYWYRGQPAPKLPPYKTGDGETRVNDADLDARIAAVVASLIADRHAGPEGVRAVVREELRALAKFFWTRDPQMARDLDTYLKAEPMKLQFTNEWLRKKIATDPDDEPEAGAPFGRAPREPAGEDARRCTCNQALGHTPHLPGCPMADPAPPAVPMGYREAAADLGVWDDAARKLADAVAAYLVVVRYIPTRDLPLGEAGPGNRLRDAYEAFRALKPLAPDALPDLLPGLRMALIHAEEVGDPLWKHWLYAQIRRLSPAAGDRDTGSTP